jgi:alditol oxidase
MLENPRNWAGNYTYGAARLHRPQAVDEVREIVSQCRKVRALGTRHAFNDIADCNEDLISLEKLDRVLAIDPQRRTVTIEGGVRYGGLGESLHRHGFGLHNLASLPHISVAGACATATHGSGEGNGNLATAVTAMELVRADGEVVAVSREKNGEGFDGMVVGLGALGVVTKLTLNVVPSYQLRQDVYENLPLRRLEEHFEEIESAAYSVSLFTDWTGDRINQVWLKRRLSDPIGELGPTFFGATPAPADRHPIARISAENCTAQMGAAGPWHERLPHFRMDFTPSSGEELQSEYLVPRRHAVAAILAVASLRRRIAPLLLICEIRAIAADQLWMSQCYQQACVAIHFTWKQDWEAVRELLPAIEEKLAPFEARPHWGKLFTISPACVQGLYAKMAGFRELLTSWDPGGKFRNAFIDRYVFGEERA